MSRSMVGIPAHNDERAIAAVVAGALRHVDGVVVIDDGSHDNTSGNAKRAGARVLRGEATLGRAAAVRRCFEFARSTDVDQLVVLDGDGQDRPEAIPHILKPLKDGIADISVGVRFTAWGEGLSLRSHLQRLATAGISRVNSSGMTLDSTSNFWAYSRKALDLIDPRAVGNPFRMETLLEARGHELRIVEVPWSVDLEQIYSDEFTTATYQELKRVGAWFNRIVGYHPVLVGGWAVYYYTRSAVGSRDIDLIFPDRFLKDRLVNQYLLTHEYERERNSEFEEQYALPVDTSLGRERIYLDVATSQDVNRMHDGGVELPWQLAFDYQRPARFGTADFYVPSPEVLLLLKTKAVLDREHDIGYSTDEFQARIKIKKDYYDMTALIKTCDFDIPLLRRLIREWRFEQAFRTALCELRRRRCVLLRLNIERRDLNRKLKALL